ncbi:MAG: transposase [Candidatus Levybacteria bacterium]|nr:transposase [Candidatus Levybacteria bacterium]
MQKKELSFRQNIVKNVLLKKLENDVACVLLTCTKKTLGNYLRKVTEGGLEDLKDKRGGNHRKLTHKQELMLIVAKKEGRWRSARKALELTGITSVKPRQIQRLWVKHNLHQENVERLKPITRFIAPYPNDLWQSDIQGKLHFPFLGDAYLVATIDDHSRQDKGSQYKASARYTQTGEYAQSTFQFYAKALGIDLVFAHKAQTKGKIEKFWRFVQQDFARENIKVKSFEELNKSFFKWQIHYNETFKHSGIGMNGRTPAEVYQPSEKRKPKQELQELLTISIRRLVYRDSSISLFGKRYKVPSEFITCRIWVRIKGETVRIESMGNVVYKFKLRV